MDLREPTLVATALGTGIPNNRKALGRMWVSSRRGNLHTNNQCHSPRSGREGMKLVPVFEEEGEIRYILNDVEYAGKLCENCPDYLDETWKKMAACQDTAEDFLTTKPTVRERLIEDYCNQCPVALECLEYGESNTENYGAIWGGLYFQTTFINDRSLREEQINQRRGELQTAALRRKVGS